MAAIDFGNPSFRSIFLAESVLEFKIKVFNGFFSSASESFFSSYPSVTFDIFVDWNGRVRERQRERSDENLELIANN